MALEQNATREDKNLTKERWELLVHLNQLTDKPMIALSFVWLILTIMDLTRGLSPLLEQINYGIWALFVIDFVIEIIIAPHKLRYLRRNWLTAISLVVPALRIFRIFRALRILRAARTVRAMSFIRVLSSVNRSMRVTAKTMGRRGIGYVVALTAIVVFAGAAGMAHFENPASLPVSATNRADTRTGIGSYSEAVWWTAMIMTTMGSDYWPVTVEGRILCWLLSLYAFAVFGYITATIASYFIGQDRKTAPKSQADLGDIRGELIALRTQLAVLAERAKQQGEG